jgi:Aspartic acid proteinase inhibitor
MNRIFFTLLALYCALSGGCSTAPLVGGYTQGTVTDKEVVAAANFATMAQSKVIHLTEIQQHAALELIRVISVEEQVVAGKKYRLTLSVNESGTRKTADAIVVWQPWRKPAPYELTSWKWH